MYNVEIVPLSLNIPKSWVVCWNLNNQPPSLTKPSISSPSISFFKNSSAISSYFSQASSPVRPVSSSACLWWLLVLLKPFFVIAHRFCCPCALLYIARKGMYARETLVGFPLHVKSPARRRPLLRSKSAAPKRKTPLRVSFFLEQGTGIEPASSAWEADVLPMY